VHDSQILQLSSCIDFLPTATALLLLLWPRHRIIDVVLEGDLILRLLRPTEPHFAFSNGVQPGFVTYHQISFLLISAYRPKIPPKAQAGLKFTLQLARSHDYYTGALFSSECTRLQSGYYRKRKHRSSPRFWNRSLGAFLSMGRFNAAVKRFCV
jgi:hypothetical protein